MRLLLTPSGSPLLVSLFFGRQWFDYGGNVLRRVANRSSEGDPASSSPILAVLQFRTSPRCVRVYPWRFRLLQSRLFCACRSSYRTKSLRAQLEVPTPPTPAALRSLCASSKTRKRALSLNPNEIVRRSTCRLLTLGCRWARNGATTCEHCSGQF